MELPEPYTLIDNGVAAVQDGDEWVGTVDFNFAQRWTEPHTLHEVRAVGMASLFRVDAPGIGATYGKAGDFLVWNPGHDSLTIWPRAAWLSEAAPVNLHVPFVKHD